jgi:hypothetical protein
MAGQIFGRAFIRIDGVTQPTLPGSSKLNPGGFERTPINGDAGYLGQTEKLVNAEVECDIAVDADTDIIGLNATKNAVVTFQCDTGQIYIVRNASLATPVSLQSGDGKASLKFIGSPAEDA